MELYDRTGTLGVERLPIIMVEGANELATTIRIYSCLI